MNIAELFISLGIKGADQAGKALKGTRDGLGEVKSMSLEAKAAIVGTVWALQNMMSKSAQTGTDLKNLSTYTGMSTKALQQWAWAAQQVGVDGKEAQAGLSAVAKAMGDARLGNAPEGMAMVANKVGLDPNQLKDTQYVMQQLQKFSQLKMDPAVQNRMLQSFGLSQNMISAMRQGAFEVEKLNKAQYVMSDGMVKSTAAVGVAWANLGSKIDFAFGQFTAKHGQSIVKDLSKMIDLIIKLAEALVKLAEKAHLFETVNQTIKGSTTIAEFAAGEKSIGGEKYAPGADKLSKTGKFFSEIGQAWSGFQDEQREEFQRDHGLDPYAKTHMQALTDWFKGAAAPALNSPGVPKNSAPETLTINQEFNFNHDGKDAQKTGESVRKAVKDSIYQLPAMNSQSR